ncbi:MAG: Asp-tRNA(Asn)/Glu-tRNA(Gln) amidotransferase subunit GatC [Candidatus Aenigmarchaeota archaeon]|nr:Asp-tRNA(Asn)/Glu-tRNA(Gln) amidotransferase subunit GatC [Candidatus Aenigmarchaeota archaeon]
MTDYWKIDEKLIEHVCKMAKIELTEEEKKKYLSQLIEILRVFKEIDEVDTVDVEPSFHPIEIKNSWREDKVEKIIWNSFENTQNKEDNYFKGPKIV